MEMLVTQSEFQLASRINLAEIIQLFYSQHV